MNVNNKSEVINVPNFSLSASIRQVRRSKGMNQAEFGRLFGVSQGAVSNWEMGVDVPTIRYLQQLSEMTADQSLLDHIQEELRGLTGIKTIIDPSRPKEGTRRIPILWEPLVAGTMRAMEKGEIREVLDLPTRWFPKTGEFYGVNVTGDSMAPIINDGSLVVLDTSKRTPGDLVHQMVAVRGRSGITIHWLREDQGVYMLAPQHASSKQPIRVLRKDGEFSLVGEVVVMIGIAPKPIKKK